jgi:starch phosphorylase
MEFRDSKRPAQPPATDARADAVTVFRAAVLSKLTYNVGRVPENATDHDWFMATALAVRDRIVDAWHEAPLANPPRKKVCYLSLEFLIGRLLSDALCNLRLTDVARKALSDLGVDLDRVAGAEPDAALGNGGLGRLAACFMESMATTGVSAGGYGIRYD